MKLGILNQDKYDYMIVQLKEEIQAGKLDIVLLDSKVPFGQQDGDTLDAVLCYRLSNEQIDDMNNLKWIFVNMTGLDGFDEKYIASKEIQIINAHAAAKYIAERGFALTMTLLGRIHEMSAAMSKNIWLRNVEDGEWTTLYNKKIGIYGYGHIGQAFHKLVMPFTSDIYTIDRHKDYKDIKLVDNLVDLAKTVDILFIGVPSTQETKGSVDNEIIQHMKNGFIINVARGNILKSTSLEKGLEENILAGYGADVWYNYPGDINNCPPCDFDTSKYKNIVMTPHNAWSSDHRFHLVDKEMICNIKKCLVK